MNGRLLGILTTLTAFGLSATCAFGQRGGFSADGFFDRLDQDGSGVIEPEEIKDSRMAGFVERMEIDTSRGITREQFSDAMQQVRERYEEERGSRDRDEGDGGDEGDRRSRWRDQDDRSSSERDDRRRDDRSSTRPRTPAPVTAAPAARVTIDLQAEFAEGDTDDDGQIGMYEWTQWKSRAELAAFLGMDRNHDGFLTPRELTRAAEAQPVDLASVLPISPTAIGTPATQADTSAPSSVAAQPQPESPPPAVNVSTFLATADPGEIQKAERYFSLLDRDRDGSISELEWAGSKRLKPKFEEAGANLTQPMSSEEFAAYYVRIFARATSGD